MRNLYSITTIRGMPVQVHYTWIIVALLGVWVLGGVTLPAFLPASGVLARLLLALLILALCFGAVVIHELAHLLVARTFGVRFLVLNLYPLGAVTRLPDPHGSPTAAFWTAAAGPAVSLLLWGILISLASGGAISLGLAVVLYVVGQFSLFLGLINLLPGLPLDGGRMLRAAFWWATGNFESATSIARRLGQIIAYGLIFFGAWRLVNIRDWMLGGALVLIGWAMREAGGTAYRRALVARLLHRLTAGEVLQTPAHVAAPEDTLQAFAHSLRGRSGREPTAVVTDGMFLGMIDREGALEVPQGLWDTRTVAETMIPAATLDVAAPDTPVSMLIPLLAAGSREQQLPVPVVQEGRLVGLIDVDQLVELLDLEDEFGLLPRHNVTQTPTEAQPAAAAPAQPTPTLQQREVNR